MKIERFDLSGYLSPGKGNPRNSEGAFLELDDGRIVYAYSRYNGSEWSDEAECDICAVFSTDGGETFDTENFVTLVHASEYGERNVMSVSLMRMQNGDIGVFYIRKLKNYIDEYVLRRYNGNLTEKLSEVVCLPNDYAAYYVINNDRVVRLSSGRIIIPAAMHSGSALEKYGNKLEYASATCFFVSDDDGFTWRRLKPKITNSDCHSNTGLQEPGVVELPNGSIYCYMRTDRMFQYEAILLDENHWFGPQPSGFSSPDSPMLIKRNPYGGKYYAIWNPIPRYQTRKSGAKVWTGERNPLVIAESTDGLNFSEPITLEDDETRGFCYPSIYFLSEKTALVAYCSGGTEDGACLNRVTLRKVEIS